MKQLLSAIALASVAVTTSTVVAAVPATASYHGSASLRMSGDGSCPDNLRARGDFIHTSDNVKSYDECADGLGSDAVIKVGPNGSQLYCYNQAGDATVKTCNYAFPENVGGWIQAQVRNNGVWQASSELGYFET